MNNLSNKTAGEFFFTCAGASELKNQG